MTSLPREARGQEFFGETSDYFATNTNDVTYDTSFYPSSTDTNSTESSGSTTNTNEVYTDPLLSSGGGFTSTSSLDSGGTLSGSSFGSFGTLSLGGGGGGVPLDDGGSFTSQAATGTYTTNSTQSWSQDSGMRTPGGAGWTISQYSFGGLTYQGQVNGGYFSTGTTIGSGTSESLRVGQTFMIRMGGEDDSGRTGIVTDGRIGFSLGSGTDIFAGGSSAAIDRATNASLVRVEFVGGASASSFTGDSTVTSSMPSFANFKSGQFYAIEILSDDEFIIRYGTSSNANTTVFNMQDFAGSGGSIGKITFYNLGANMASLFSNIVVSNSPYLNFSNNSNENSTISGIISDNGSTANAAVKNGAGTVTFSGNNTYTGATTVSNGVLAVSVNNALGTTAAGTTILTNTTLDFRGVTYSTAEGVTNNGGTIAASTGTSAFAGGVTLGGNSTFSVDGTQLALSGIITDGASTFGITKSGSGLLILSNANTFDGNTTISAGALRAENNSALGATGTVGVASGASMQLSNVTIARGLTLTNDGGGSGALRNIGGNSTWSGNITNAGGAAGGARINSDSGTLTIGGNITSGVNNLYVGGSGNVTI